VELAVNRSPSPPPGGRPGGGYKASGAQEYSEVVEGGAVAAGGGKPLMYLLLLVVLTVIGFAAYEFFVNERNPVDTVTAWVDQLAGGGADESEPAPLTPEQKAKAKAAAAKRAKAADEAMAAAAAKAKAAETLAPVVGNPYWALPNKIYGKLPLARLWTSDEEETFRAGITHRFSYQRWQTVQSIRKLRLSGSDVVLWDAMQDRKFWTRMAAAVGLAELNIELSLNVIEGLMTDQRSELVADYFERFTRRPNGGQAFMLRQVVRLLDEKGRLIALQGIARSQDPLRDLYMAAATRDPGRHVQRWIARHLREHPIAPARLDKLLAVVDGRSAAEDVAAEPATATAPTKSGKTVGAATPEPGFVEGEPDPVAEDDPSAMEFDDVGGASDGDVEFYETTDDSAVSDTADPETFEYTE
jgi:hypothetical protein